MHSTARALWILLLGAAAVPACGPGGGPSPEEAAQRAEQLRTASAAYAGAGAQELVADAEAMDLAGELFAAHCAGCHGADARGRRGVPSLRSGSLAYGAEAEAVRTTITHGRTSVMPAAGDELGEVEIGQVVAFVESLATSAPLGDYEQRGKRLYASHCAECHGPEGLGIRELGTPSLADDDWQHGGSMMNIRLVITRGAESQCPAQQEELSAPQIELLTAYVLSLRARESRGSDPSFN